MDYSIDRTTTGLEVTGGCMYTDQVLSKMSKIPEILQILVIFPEFQFKVYYTEKVEFRTNCHSFTIVRLSTNSIDGIFRIRLITQNILDSFQCIGLKMFPNDFMAMETTVPSNSREFWNLQTQ